MLNNMGELIPPCLTTPYLQENLMKLNCPIEHTSSGVYTKKAAI